MSAEKKKENLSEYIHSVSLPPCGHTFHHSFSTTQILLLSRSAHTINYVIILSLMYLHPELLIFLHLPFQSTNFPHLVALILIWREQNQNICTLLLLWIYLTSHIVGPLFVHLTCDTIILFVYLLMKLS